MTATRITFGAALCGLLAAGAPAPGSDEVFLGVPPCPTLGDVEGCTIQPAALEGSDLPDGNTLLVVHYNAGVTQGTASLADVAFLEIRAAQLATSPTLPDPQNHALHLVLAMPTSDGSNLPPALLTLDAALGGLGEPAFGGLPAAWTLDHHDGANAPGDLSGARDHTLMFGGAAGVCDVEQTFATPAEQVLRALLRVEDGILHSLAGPEVDVTTATTWDGAAFTVPVPGLAVVEPFLLAELFLVDAGFSAVPSLLTGSAEPALVDFVQVWTTDACARGTLAPVATNRLGLDVVDPQTCYATGDLVEVELAMSCLEGDVTGFFASVSYDPAILALQTAMSAYTTTPFPLHISVPIVDAGGGTILLDGSVGFVDPGTDDDALLATLVFEVLSGNDFLPAGVAFTTGGTFPSELSFEGLPVPTRLGDPLGWTIDDTPPALACAPDVTVAADPGTCGALVALAPPASSDACGVLSVVGVRSDALPLEMPFPAGCAPGMPTTVTWTATDCAGQTAACVQTVRVIDAEAPVLAGLPADIDVSLPAGACTATVSFTPPTATDTCDPSPSVVCIRSDALPLGAPYPAGTTIVTCTATDACLNFTADTFAITVEETNAVDVEVVLAGVFTPVTRCIRFRTSDCSESDVLLAFGDLDSNPATPVQAISTVDVPCGAYTTLCAKDAQHTQWASTTLSGLGGRAYVADSVLVLDGGDTDDDGDVDINDITWFLAQFGTLADDGGCPWDGTTRDADFSNNGAIGSEDYPFLTSSFLSASSCACTPSLVLASGPGPGPGPGTGTGTGTGSGAGPGAGGTAWSLPLAQVPAWMHARVDLDGDGVVDHVDVRLFEERHGLPHELSGALLAASLGAPR